MFTGTGPSDLIRKAAEKAAAAEPPATFLGREGLTMQTEVQVALPFLRSMQAAALKRMLAGALVYGQEGEISEADLREACAELKPQADDEFIVSFTGIYFMLRTAVKQHTRLDNVEKDLTALKLAPEFVAAFRSALHKTRFEIENNAHDRRIRHPRLDRLQWRCDVTISSVRLKRVLKPSVTMQMTLSDGRIKSFEMPMDKFHEMRYNVAKVLQHMQELEGHPMMRIMDALEEDERKKM